MFYSELPHSCTKSVLSCYEPALELIAPIFIPHYNFMLHITGDVLYPLILHQSARYPDKHWASILYLRTANVFSAFSFLKVLFFCQFSSCVSGLYIRVVTSVLKLSLVKTTLAVHVGKAVVRSFHLFYTQLLTHSSVSSSQCDL